MIYGDCDKCGTKSSEVFEFEDGRWLCKANECYAEEYEKIDGKSERDLENLENYRNMVARTKNLPPDIY